MPGASFDVLAEPRLTKCLPFGAETQPLERWEERPLERVLLRKNALYGTMCGRHKPGVGRWTRLHARFQPNVGGSIGETSGG